MSWLKNKKARRTLQGLGLNEEASNEMVAELAQGYRDTKKLRDDLSKNESRTYKKLIRQINNISYEPTPVKQKYQQTLELIQTASLTEWERTDLLNQMESLYKEFLEASPYAQVLGMLNHIKSDNVTKAQKLNNSMKLIDSSDITEAQKMELAEQVKRVYGV